MKERLKKNSGFTLVELIIAMAILAFLMTAVSAFMGSGVMSFKKAKADITVHNSAQEVYDQLSDTIMSANDMIVYGYVMQGTVVIDPSAPPVTPSGNKLTFSISGNTSTEALDGPYYFVKDEAQKTALEAMPEYETGKAILYYTQLSADTEVYVKQLIIDKAVEIDMSNVGTPVAGKYLNHLTGDEVVITEQKRLIDEIDSTESDDYAQSSLGDTVYSEKDTERNIYTFDDENMYCERKYAYMTALDDYASTSDKSDYLYTESLSYLKDVTADSGTDDITGCVFKINADKGSVEMNLFFSDKNMTYTSLGMINTRNSYVLKAKK